jgi:hypothetical protein
MSGDTMADAYALLGVTPEASELEVRRAYRRLARTLHPDLQPEPLREQSGRRLQAVNAARAQVLAEIRSRRPATSGAAPGTTAPVPRQRRPPEEVDQLRRWIEHQEWLELQRQHTDAWAVARASREQGRREQLEQDHRRRSRRLWSGRRRAIALLPVVVAAQVAVVWGAVQGVERVVSAVTAQQHSVARVQDDPDLRDVLALLGSWRS